MCTGLLFIFVAAIFGWQCGTTMAGCFDLSTADICNKRPPRVPYLWKSRDPSSTAKDNFLQRKYCDLFAMEKQKWYSSKITMANTCPDIYKCGTKFPIWMKGVQPEPDEGIVNRTACLRGFDNCCLISYKVAAVSCRNYVAYCLLELPSGCPQRYCFAKQTKVNISIASTTAKWSKNDPLDSATTVQPQSETNYERGKLVAGCFNSSIADVCKITTPEVPYLSSRHPLYTGMRELLHWEYCDSFALKKQQWYRSGITMAATCPEMYRCGAKFPIWMNGIHPAPNEGIVNRTACLRGFETCCVISHKLAVVNCGQHMAYCLLDLPSRCPQRYCFGNTTEDKQIKISKYGASRWNRNLTAYSVTTVSPESDVEMPFTNAQVMIAIIVMVVFGLTAVAVIALLKYKRSHCERSLDNLHADISTFRLKMKGGTTSTDKETLKMTTGSQNVSVLGLEKPAMG